jgi:sugar-specific transcriptional regulator TrmB
MESSISGDIYWKLGKLGLRANDAKVYVYLLERGEAFSGSKIAAALKMHRQYVYDSLKELHSLGLIEEIPSGARTRYKALPPQQLSHLAKRQVEYADSAAQELELLSAIGSDQDFEVYRGARQVRQFEERFIDELEDNATQYIIGGGSRAFYDFFGDEFEELFQIAGKRKLTSFYIGSRDDGPLLDRSVAIQPLFQYRILSNLSPTITSTVIRNDVVIFYSFGKPPLVYVIKSKKVAEDYKKIFDILWSIAK